MKKVIFVLVFVFSLYSATFASNMNLEYDGEKHIYNGPDVKLILNGETFVPSQGQMPPVIIGDRTLVPVREVFEKLGGNVLWDGEERSVEVTFGAKVIKLWLDSTSAIVDGEQKTLDVPGKLINEKTMVPVRFISENAGLDVGWDGTTSTVTITEKNEHDFVNINSVEYKEINGVKVICVSLDKKAKYNFFSLSEPDRIILDIENSEFKINREPLTFKDNELFSQIRFGVQENNVNRLVIDMNKVSKYTVKESENGQEIYIAFSETFDITPSKPDEPSNSTPNEPTDVKPDDNNPNKPEPNDESEEPPISDDDKKDVEIISSITAVKYSMASEKLRIILDGKFEYELTTLENPKRIVLDFTNADLKVDGPTTINLKNKPISTIESESNEDGTARVILNISENATYEISKKTSELQVKVEEPAYRNVEYTNVDEYAEIVLRNVELAKLTRTQSKNTKKYTIKYSSSAFDCGTGTLDINDEFVKKIAITKTKITVTDKGNMRYSAKQVGDDVIIKIEKVDTSGMKTILLDAGHGGDDPGSKNGTNYERTYNLKILLKLKEILEDEGYTVYTTRESDKTLTVDDRVSLATEDYPEAALYISIHHNAVDDKKASGTLVMYCDRDTSDYGITNKEFAGYVLEELVDNLGTINRGFIKVSQDNTTKRVLTEVPMPSIICEVAFMSNDEEFARIKTDKFQSRAAEAIFNGIEKALRKMD